MNLATRDGGYKDLANNYHPIHPMNSLIKKILTLEGEEADDNVASVYKGGWRGWCVIDNMRPDNKNIRLKGVDVEVAMLVC